MSTTITERKLAYMLRAAVIDAQHVEVLAKKAIDRHKKPSMKLDMWLFCKKDGSTCYMCLGGARAILGLGASKTEFEQWPQDVRDTAEVVDEMRKGSFRIAASWVSGRRNFRATTRMYEAAELVGKHYSGDLGRATFEAYLRAACVLLGQKDPGPSSAFA